ncbi:MAG: FeoB-associated Cys-rich membrane protein [Selenomonadaceae bacterium]
MADYIIGSIIALIVIIVVVRRVRQWRRGRYCDCGCSGCTTKCKDRKKEK